MILYTFPIEKLANISYDAKDYRAFGFIFLDTDEKYKFFGIKTALASEYAYSAIIEVCRLKSEMKELSGEESEQAEDCAQEDDEVKIR